MAKVLTFSLSFPRKQFPDYGKPTNFIEKYWNSIPDDNAPIKHLEVIDKDRYHPHDDRLRPLNFNVPYEVFWPFFDSMVHARPLNITKIAPKLHTIRAGKRWKAGDYFSPRVWSGKPYNSKQIKIGPDRKVSKVWDIEIDELGVVSVSDNKSPFSILFNDKFILGTWNLNTLANNDGLLLEEFIKWFELDKQAAFSGQIICWDENLKY